MSSENLRTRSDAALVQACRRGDAAAWEALVNRYQRFVVAIPSRAGLDEQATADIFQEVFLALVQGLDDLYDPERVGAWILTITKRATWRQLRRRNLERTGQAELTADAADEMQDDVEPLPEHELLRLEEQHEVRTALGALDERCQRLLTLLFYTPTPPAYAEVADSLGIAEGSVGPIRVRCLERLQRLLARQLSVLSEAAPNTIDTKRSV